MVFGWKSVWLEWAEVTTAHGFYDLSKAKSIIAKLFWFLLIAVSLTMMSYQLYKLISSYSDKQWSTATQEIPSDSLMLPSVTICNVNRIKQSNADHYGLTNDLAQFIFMHMDTQYVISNINTSLAVQQQFTAWRKAHNFSYMDIFDKLAHSYQDLVFPGQMTPIMTLTDTLDYSRCYSLNYNGSSSNIAGSKQGILFVLDTQVWDYMPAYYNNHLYEGIALQIGYNGRIELSEWQMLQPGTRTSIGMQVYERTLRAEEEPSPLNPFGYITSKPPCLRNPQYWFSKILPYTYTVQGCQKECEWVMAVRRCNCIPFVRNDRYRTCEVEELNRCQGIGPKDPINDFTQTPISQEIKAERAQCMATCQAPCFDRYIDVQTTVTTSPSQAQLSSSLMDFLNVYRGGQYMRIEDLIMLEVYFNSLSVNSIELFEVVTLENLVSNAGGLIGLWVGMSFLTVFQAIDYFIKFLKSGTSKTPNAKIQPSIANEEIYYKDRMEF